MKKVIATLILTILFTATVQAGLGPFIDDLLVTDLGEGLTRVEGSLVGVRFADDDVQQIGCRVAGNRGGDPSVTCAAIDLNEDLYLCFSFDPALIEAAISISPYSYVRFVYDETAECESILVSVRSHHIPDADSEKSKTK
jgi:hypothetical protein